MVRVWLVFVSVLIISPLQADWLQAVKAHQSQNYALAKEQFSQLIPYGNKDAAFNLATMHLYGEGIAVDYSMALAYFKLAAALGHTNTVEVITQLQQNLDDTQLASADQELVKLQHVARWWLLPHSSNIDAVLSPSPIKREAPLYPLNAYRTGAIGYVTLRFLVDEQGVVQTAKVMDAFPEKTFDQSALRALKTWRYEATGAKQILTTRFDYSLNEELNIDAVELLIEQHQLWRGALLGSAQHQFLLGSLLQLLDTQKVKLSVIDNDMPLSAKLDLSTFRTMSPVTADFSGFVGNAEVRVAADGTIIELLRTDFSDENKLQTLLGLKLTGTLESDVYRLNRSADRQTESVLVMPIMTIPPSLTARFWWDKAARNGSKAAQRIVAPHDQRWEHILVEEQDAEAMAWAGSRMLLEGDREAGLALLEAAIAKQYTPALELKRLLM
ncbi:TonB family protein [Arsukibacterium sp.]|uniref:TonB family protein n=1 Tax=Arsukibacterium sp. TaxID=1977258 RepID=UPI0035619485